MIMQGGRGGGGSAVPKQVVRQSRLKRPLPRLNRKQKYVQPSSRLVLKCRVMKTWAFQAMHGAHQKGHIILETHHARTQRQ